MLIVCPNCQTSYDVAAGSVGAEGRSVRCVRCREVWHAMPAEEQAAPPVEAAGVSAAAAVAQYRRGAGASGAASAPPTADDAWGQTEQGDGDELSVDPNLAARAAERSTVHYDDPPMMDAGAQAVGMDGDGMDAGGIDRDGLDGGDGLAAYDAPPLAPAADDAAAAPDHASHEPIENIETFAARRARREAHRHERRRGPSLAMITLTLLAVNAALIGWRSDVVRVMPQTASLFAAIGLPVNLRGLAFMDVTTTKETHDGVTVLLVQGAIANISRQPRDVPRIRLAVKNDAGAEVYTWTSLPVHPVLAPGDAEQFTTRLASPPADGHAVVVRFFTRRDIAGGAH